MENLKPYELLFNREYPKYEDARYKDICDLVSTYNGVEIQNLLCSAEWLNIQKILRPLIAIKNYKSQVPFPEDLHAIVNVIYELTQLKNINHSLTGPTYDLLERLLNIQGFQLPTASAVFHFFHPGVFPVIDKNVVAACKLLKERNQEEFSNLILPKIPFSHSSAANKINRYHEFITFMDRIVELQTQYNHPDMSLRFIDKALMIYGVDKLRKNVE